MFARKAPWKRSQVPDILNWAAEHLQVHADPDDEMGGLRKEKLQVEIRKLKASAATAETALARERGELLDATEVEREWGNIGQIMRVAIQDLSASVISLALQCGLPPVSTEEYTRKINDLSADILSHLSRDASVETDHEGEGDISSESATEGAMVS